MAVNLSPLGGVAAQFFNNDGVPLSGGLIYTYTAGTNTPANTYTTGAGTIAHSNPIVLDSAGRVPTGEIWLLDGVAYKFFIKDAQNNLIGTYDNIVGINSNFVNYTASQEIQTATDGQTVFTLTTMAYQPGTNSLSVFVDGVNQYGPGAQYAFVETSSTSVTFASGLHVGASVKFTTAVINNIGGVDASQVTYDPPFTGSEVTTVENKLSEIVSVKDFGAVGDGAADDTAAIQLAFNSGENCIHFPPGTYKTTSTMTFGDVSILMDPGATISATNAGVVLQSTAECVARTYQLNIDNSQAGATCVDFAYGASRNLFYLKLGGANAANSTGIRLRGESPASVAVGVFSNTFVRPLISGFAICQYLNGSNIADARANGNTTIGGVLTPYQWAVKVHGQGNSWQGTVMNVPNDVAQDERVYIGPPDATSDDISILNSFSDCYMDDTGSVPAIYVNVSNTIFSPICVIYNCIGLTDVDKVNDVNAGGTSSSRVLFDSYGRATFTGAVTLKSTNTALAAGADMDTAYAFMGDSSNATMYLKGYSTGGAASGRIFLGGQTWAGNNACPANGGVGIAVANGTKFRVSRAISGTSYEPRIDYGFASGANTEDYMYWAFRDVYNFVGNRTTPEGAVTAGPGSIYQSNTAGKLFVKETGTGNTGWVQK
jgi:hypothetical protein